MPECPGSHCSSVSAQINDICKSDGFSGNVVYVSMPDGTMCYCKCSCLAYNTLIAVSTDGWKKIQDFQVGDAVLKATPEKKWVTTNVAFSDGTKGDGSIVPYTIYVKTESGITLIVTPEHPFLLETGKLQRADRLTLQDKLVDEKFNPVPIKELAYGLYSGGIHNISTSTGGPGEPMWEHLINTAGVVSGDYYAQLFLVPEAILSHPQIGSPEYTEKYGKLEPKIQLPITIGEDETNNFEPYKKFVPPPNSVSFIPDYMATPAPDMLEPLDNPVPLEIAEYLVNLFKHFYPDVIYHIEWMDNTVNAYAWRDGNERHVAILGGIIRHKYIMQEGLGLVISHELGHHYGGPPYYPEGLSCEGQSDWWGARIAMREVWWGEEYIRQTIAAADQLYNLFSKGLVMGISVEEERKLLTEMNGCGHPDAECRKETYLAAVRLDPKPDCANLYLAKGKYCNG